MVTTTEPIDVESREIVPVAQSPATLYGTAEPQAIIERATAQATVLAKVVDDRRLFANINGRKHVLLEGWTTLGALVGVFAVPVWTREVADGWEARVEARTMTGAVVGAAEAQCLRTERMWAERDDYALRSMAQTRASSKALRLPLGFIMTLAGFDPTPADEMPHENNGTEAPRATTNGRATQGRAAARPAQAPAQRGPLGGITEGQNRALHAISASVKKLDGSMWDTVMADISERHPHAVDDGGLHFARLTAKEAGAIIMDLQKLERDLKAGPGEASVDPDDLPFE